MTGKPDPEPSVSLELLGHQRDSHRKGSPLEEPPSLANRHLANWAAEWEKGERTP